MERPETVRSETRSVSVAASVEAVRAVVGDASRLPEWAPNLAEAPSAAG